MAVTVVGRVVGLSAYEVAVENGFEGTEEQWLDSLGSGSTSSGYTNDEIDEKFEAVDESLGEIDSILESINGE